MPCNETVSHGCINHKRKVPPGDEVVISGISGRFPESDNIDQLKYNLLNKVDMVTDDERRWKLTDPEIPQRTGKVNGITKFDALFFGVHSKQVNAMDPMIRGILEHAVESVLDAGVNPRTLRGSNTGVFIGTCHSESEKQWFYSKTEANGFGLTGCSRAMLANRISYSLDLKGPSYVTDTACSSSLYALEQAYRAISEGLCDMAIVGGANLCMHPYVSLQFYRLGVLSADGSCKVFDEDANGYARSETISTIFLQRAKDAKRIYATVSHALTNCDGFKEEGVTFPSSQMQGVLLKKFYDQCGVPPSLVEYVEAHGTGTQAGDPEEMNAIDKIFCTGRKTPLKIGSVKSNLGHAEPASGMCCVAKVIIGMETGLIPPNINFNNPRKDLKALIEGRVTVVTEPTPWEGGYVGINSFGFGGANAHILLKSHSKKKVNNGEPNDDLPRLVAVSGRTVEAVTTILDDLSSRPVDVEYVALYHSIHSQDINNHLYRGFTLLPSHGINKSPTYKIEQYPGKKRPVWFVFSGMGSQWPGMGKSLLRLSVFYKAIQKCDVILKPKNIDIFHILTNEDKSAFDNILNSFLGIAAVQIGLVDVLKSLEIEPDNIIGHSVGELGCAYADGCFTAEQVILSAYSRGMASREANIIQGSMAAVGMGYKELKNLCPPEIQVACHNSAESATISGPADSMKAFVADLTAKQIFAREVPCNNIPYHSRYIASAGPKLLDSLQKVIPNPKQRSAKWLSTSVPVDKWDTPAAKYSSAEYHTNNLLSPVLFEETSAFIPKDAITIEIAPHGLLQAILRRSLDPGVTNLALTQRGNNDNVQVLLQALGNMYNCGMQPRIANLYPQVEFPVSSSTRMISPLIKWEHSTDWRVAEFNEKIDSCERVIDISLKDDGFEFVRGHVIDGRNLFPATGYMYLTWETLGLIRGEHYTGFSVVFEDIKFLRATTVPETGTVTLTVVIHKGTGRFEIIEGDTAVVTGHVRATTDSTTEKIKPPITSSGEDELMTSRDVYKELRLRGYHYSGLFRSVKSSSVDGTKGTISWLNNWVAFMDNMLQMQILGVDSRGLFVPTAIKKLVIDPKVHTSELKENDSKELPVYVNKLFNTIVSGGIEIRDLKASAIGRRKPAGDPVLEDYKFISHLDEANVDRRELVRLVTHICLENHLDLKVKTLELIEGDDEVIDENNFSFLASEAFGDLPLIQADINIISDKDPQVDLLPANVSVINVKNIDKNTNALLAIGRGLLDKNSSKTLEILLSGLRESGFLLTTILNSSKLEESVSGKDLEVILTKKCDKNFYVLLRKRGKVPQKISIIHVKNQQLDWIDEMREKLNAESENSKKELSRIIFVGQDGFDNGLLGLVNCLRKELGGESVRGILIQDPKAPEFSLDSPLYANQLKKDLVVNVLREKSTWGSYRHLPLPSLDQKPVRHAFVNQLSRGDLSSLTWIEGPIPSDYKDKNLVNIYYSSLNFRDVMLATGKLAVEVVSTNRKGQECVIGIEFSGVSSSGKRLMGMVENGALSNLCIGDDDLAWEIPKNWSLEDGATVPCVYGTCYYALYQKGKMKKGDKVLIHAGTGGIGQAAINLALHEGCEVFTTVGTPEKFQFIRKNFPQIREDHIGNSRDTSFEKMIIQLTNGQGVDIVLNSLAEEKLRASVHCLAWGGRFLEIGKFDLSNNNSLGMEPFLKEISFQGVMLDHLFSTTNADKMELKELMYNGLKNGAIKPLVRTVFPKDQIEAAFRYMAGGKHMGKVLIKVQDSEVLKTSILAIPRFYCHPDRSYVILGGLGGFGLELADWLALRGAKNIILTSRSGVKNGYQKMRIQLWQSYGIKVRIVINKDASKREDCEQILKSAITLAPIDGIFNLAVVLKDALWDNQSQESFKESFRAKALSTQQLDTLTRTLCPNLRHFVVFSSVSCGRGNAGQTNYGMSNSIMERICEKRVAEGLPGLAIQWGAVGDVGLVADMQDDNKELVIGGTLQQSINSCLQELDKFLSQKQPVVASMVVAEKRIKKAGSANLTITETIINIIGLKDLKGVSPNTSLAEIGMDSMMGVEIKQTLEREFEIFLTAQDIRGLSFSKLQEMDNNLKKSDSKGPSGKRESSGVGLLIRLIGIDNINNETCVNLNTQGDAKNDEIFLIPGLEGLGSVFSVLASKIKAPAKCLQPGIDSKSQKSFSDIADLFLPHVLSKKTKSGQYHIVGYSTGTMIAIELARKLEAKGLKCQLIFIDGAPKYLQTATERLYNTKNEEEFQDKLLLSTMSIIAPDRVEELFNNLKRCKNTWEDKLELVVALWPTAEFKISNEHLRLLLTSVYKRLALLNKGTSEAPRIKSPITLIKPSSPIYQPTDENYNLSEVTSGEVNVYNFKGDHVTILDNDEVADIINGEFKKSS